MTETTTKKRSLFDIGDDLIAIENLIEERDGDISDPDVCDAITAWMAEMEGDLAAKTDGYVNLIRKWESEASAAKAEAEQYQKAAEVRANRVRSLKDRLKGWMQMMNRAKIETATGRTIAVQNNGGVEPVAVDDTKTEFLDRAMTGMQLNAADFILPELAPFIRVKVELDIKAVRDHLKAGNSLPFATLQPRGQQLRIR
jgi:hypothetical protein